MRNNSLKNHRVLVLDSELPSSYTILRSLSQHGIECDIASSAEIPISKYSKYAKHNYCYPNPLTQSQAFIEWICNLLNEVKYDLVIPVTERSLIPLSSSDKLDPWRNLLAIANKPDLELVLNKDKTLSLARNCDVPTPFSFHISTPEELNEITPKLEYPIVIKPINSIPTANNRQQLSVTYAHNKDEVIKLGTSLLSHCPILIQQYAKGIGTGIEILANHGDIVYAFQHERVHELPLTGGGSCLRKSIKVNQTLLEASQRLISALNWHGVAMVEFKWQPELGRYWLMEINGRFWGSLPLAYAAGADFPFMLYNMLVNKKLPDSRYYQENIYCRKLTADISWYEQIMRRGGDKRLVKYPSKKQLLSDLILILHPTRHFFDIQNWRDPLPGLIDFSRMLKEYYRRGFELLYLKFLSTLHKSKWMQIRLSKYLKSAQSILFLCYGNINRSALAQVLAEQYYSDTDIHFDSAGFHLIEGRPADPRMVSIAESYNINLSNCSSKTINKSILKQADVIFVMELQQYIRIKKTYPEHIKKTFLLGSLNENKDIDIPDPYNKPLDHYKNCYLAITSAIENLKLKPHENNLRTDNHKA